ncbi:MAG: zinc-binding dehydrogenase [Thiothrix sp.]
MPEIALAKINPSAAPLDKVCSLGCGVTTGIGAVLNTGKVEPGSTVAVFGLGGIGLSCIQGAVMAQAGRIIAVDINPDKWEMAKALGATDFVNPKAINGSVVEYIKDLTNGGSITRLNASVTHIMRDALECTHMGGWPTIIGVAGAGQEIATCPFQLVIGRTWKGIRIWWCQRPYRTARLRRPLYERADRTGQHGHAHHAAGRHQPRVRPDAHGRKASAP